jgi:serine O-acetyltransferase
MISSIKNSLYVLFLRILLKFGTDEGNKSVVSLVETDLYRCIGSRDINKLYNYILIDPGFKFIFFLRFASVRPTSAFKKRIHAFSYYFHNKYFFKYGFQVPIQTTIGKGFQFLHFGNIVFNPLAVIGENCTVAQGVLIGQSNRGVPVIGNFVWIGANAILVGRITIGNNVLIAPGSYVNIDVPENSLVMGNPCVIISKSPSIIDGYIVNKVNI